MDILDRLRAMSIASCTCGAKPPALEHHQETCHWRVICETIAEIEEHDRVMQMMHDADRRGTKLWRDANPGNELVLPDQGRLVEFLIGELDKATATNVRLRSHILQGAVDSMKEES